VLVQQLQELKRQVRVRKHRVRILPLG
jgi:hypothetical protein